MPIIKNGPCVMCGEDDYPLSFGGPGICPACDCGTPPEVTKLRRENQILKKRISELENPLTHR